MQNLTQTQQTDLQAWLKDTSQELPASLENVLIEHFLETLQNDINSRILFNKGFAKFTYVSQKTGLLGFGLGARSLDTHETGDQILIILTLLSRTAPTPEKPNGEAVVPFLDIPSKKYVARRKEYILDPDYIFKSGELLVQETPKTLQGELLKNFTEICFGQGKGPDKAKLEITKTYLINVYA